MPYAAGDIINFEFTGAAQTIQLPPGRYKLEVWGAQGGSYSSYAGGNGGYSVGVLALPKITADTLTTLHVYVGGQPATVTTDRAVVPGGFNGGGNGQNRYYRSTYTYGQGGGGATDIRIGEDSLYARVIVAGAGGGSASVDAASTKYGGGASGGSPQSGYGASQTAAGTNGAFGQGGSATTSGTGDKYGSGGGGGGWYGGGACSSYSNFTNYRGYNGGGSGFVWIGENAPSGYLLGEEYYLTDAQTIAGSTSFTAPDGTAETGHSGNGYARITVLEIYTFGPKTPANFRQASQDYFSIGLAWDAEEDAAGYRLYKDGSLLADLTASSYADGGMVPSETHTYTLIAYNEDGESDPATLTAETAFAYYVVLPVFHSASFSINPADMNAKTVLTVDVTDEFKIMEPEYFYSGEIYSGEV